MTGSPAPVTGVVSGLTNGSAYTFTVTATNSVGTSGDSAQSNAVTPQASPQFVQRVSGRTAATTLQLTPASVITTGNRMVVMAGVWSNGGATISGVTDSAGNAYTKLAGQAASEHTELSVWSAPITAGGGTKPTVTVTATGSADIGGAALEYSGLSTAAGAAAVDQFKIATGTSSSAGFVTSGPTAALTGDNGLAMGFYVDSGFGRTLSADPELHGEGQRLADLGHGVRGRGRAAAARRHAGGARLDGREHAVADGDRRVQDRRGRAACAASPVDLAGLAGVHGDGRRVEPGGEDA